MSEIQKKIMLIGRTGAGKTTICQILNNEIMSYHKTQSIQVVGDRMIDTPGEYTERRFRYGSLQVTSTAADIILFVKDATEVGSMLAPGFSSMFAKPTVGIITKIDLADELMIEKADNFLRMAGAQIIFPVSCVTGEGMQELKDYLVQL